MGLSLKDGMYAARYAIGELYQFNWSNNFLKFHLNLAAKTMCSVANALTKYEAVPLQYVESTGPTGVQEAALDEEIDMVKNCTYFSGQVFKLEPRDWKYLQVGASTGSIPRWYYLKTDTKDLTPQSTATSNIQDIPLDPNSPGGQVYRTVIGCWPIPPAPAVLDVWYSYWHKYMNAPNDPCAIPPPFLNGWVAGAIEQCLLSEKAFGDAAYYTKVKDVETEKYRIYASSHRNSDQPMRYGVEVDPWRQNASSSVILVDPFPTFNAS